MGSSSGDQLSYSLEIVQQPIHARAMGWGTKCMKIINLYPIVLIVLTEGDSRRPVDPPPVIYFTIIDKLGNPVTHEIANIFILHASLYEVSSRDPSGPPKRVLVSRRLTGTTVVSLSHIKSPAPGRFYFLLHDISIRQEGRYQLEFNVWEVMSRTGCLVHRGREHSDIIVVYSPKAFPGLETSSELIREMASQGCKVRVRKESMLKRKKLKREQRLKECFNDQLVMYPDIRRPCDSGNYSSPSSEASFAFSPYDTYVDPRQERVEEQKYPRLPIPPSTQYYQDPGVPLAAYYNQDLRQPTYVYPAPPIDGYSDTGRINYDSPRAVNCPPHYLPMGQSRVIGFGQTFTLVAPNATIPNQTPSSSSAYNPSDLGCYGAVFY
jgi:hypothetical protein